MRIAYIGSFGRLFDEEGIARSFEKLGVTIERYSEKKITEDAVKQIINSKPDFILFAKLKFDYWLREELINRAKDFGIKTICFVPDLYFGLSREFVVVTKDPIFQADYVFTPDGGHDELFKKYGVNHYLIRQGIYDGECVFYPANNPQGLVFVGVNNPEYHYRFNMLKYISDNYDDFEWFGRKFDDEIRGQDLNKLYATKKIVIGDSVYSPYYWSNRIYETLGRGGFLIHPKIPGLEKEFEYYKHFIPYNIGNLEELKEIIDYYSNNDEEREKIRKEGFEFVRDNHTLIHRVKQILEIIK